MHKRRMIESIVPVAIALKNQLAACRHKHLTLVFEYIRILLADYKNDLDEVCKEKECRVRFEVCADIGS